MRFVPTFCLREGMTLGKSLYGQKGEFLLREGTVFNTSFIDAVHRLNYNGVYVSDDLSNDIEIKSVISDSLRIETVSNIKKAFISLENNHKNGISKMDDMKKHIEALIDEIIKNKHLMINLIDLKIFDDYTYYHSVNVAVLSIVIGVELNYSKKQLYELGLGALLHDIGKVFIHKNILNKPGKLTDMEYEVIKEHTTEGFHYVKSEYDIPIKSRLGIVDHHERFDGYGYPNKKSKDGISLNGRIIAISDVYDALVSDRPYRKALPPSEAMENVMGGCGSCFDPDLVDIFVRKVAPYPVGTCVSLSNGMIAIVLENYEDACLRPKVRVFRNAVEDVNPFEIDLRNSSSFNITIVSLWGDY
jgi:HD-GYP domain-containing protein (c-di-GMP phosphodiesterase class II)